MYGFSHPKKALTVIILSSVLQTACMVGPNFRSPFSPKVKHYTETPLPAKTAKTSTPGGKSQTFNVGKEIPDIWWELYRSPEINELVRAGLVHNPTLASAAAAVRQAQENVKVQVGNSLFPSINETTYVQRQRYSALQIGVPGRSQTFSLYVSGLTLAYTLDFFGGARREIESLRAQVDYQQFELIAAYLTLTSNIVTTAITVASLQAQINATIELINAEQGLLNIFNQRFNLGGISNVDVLTQKTLVEQTRATLPPLQKSLSQSKHALSALVGTFPDRPLPEIRMESLKLPIELPVSFPSQLVRQRPDVRAAEALLHAACAQVGVATANLFPQLTLNAQEGWINTTWAQLFTAPNNIWSITGQVMQPLFHGGALFAQRRAAIAAYNQSAAQYQQTVLQAFREVADVLKAVEIDARGLQAQANAESAAGDLLKLTMNKYRLGSASYLDLLNAQQQYQQTKIARIQAETLRYTDTAALFQALGGGWWRRPWCVKECI